MAPAPAQRTLQEQAPQLVARAAVAVALPHLSCCPTPHAPARPFLAPIVPTKPQLGSCHEEQHKTQNTQIKKQSSSLMTLGKHLSLPNVIDLTWKNGKQQKDKEKHIVASIYLQVDTTRTTPMTMQQTKERNKERDIIVTIYLKVDTTCTLYNTNDNGTNKENKTKKEILLRPSISRLTPHAQDLSVPPLSPCSPLVPTIRKEMGPKKGTQTNQL